MTQDNFRRISNDKNNSIESRAVSQENSCSLRNGKTILKDTLKRKSETSLKPILSLKQMKF